MCLCGAKVLNVSHTATQLVINNGVFGSRCQCATQLVAPGACLLGDLAKLPERRQRAHTSDFGRLGPGSLGGKLPASRLHPNSP